MRQSHFYYTVGASAIIFPSKSKLVGKWEWNGGFKGFSIFSFSIQAYVSEFTVYAQLGLET